MNRLRRLARDDRGLTLTELITAMAITAIALALVGGFFATVMRLTSDGRNTRTATGIAANAIDEIGRVVRAAGPVATSSSTQLPAVAAGSGATALTVIAWVDVDPASPVPSRTVFAVNAQGDLVETRTAGVPSGLYWSFTGLTTTRTIPGPITVAYAYQADSGTDAGPTAVTPSDDANAGKVTSVTITVTTRPASVRDVPVTLSTTALMPNTTIQ